MTIRQLGAAETHLLRGLVMASADGSAALRDDESGCDWSSFLAATRRHRLGPLVLRGAESASFLLPEGIRASLVNDQSRELARTAIQLDALDRINDIAISTGRTVVTLKGAWSKMALYPHPGLRPMVDLDVLAEPGTLAAWRASLVEIGYEVRDEAEHATLLAHPTRGVYVELHRALTSCGRFLGLHTEPLFERSVSAPGYENEHTRIRTLCLEDHLLHLTLHASFQHGMRQAAVNAWDAHLLARKPEFDVNAFLERADRSPMRSFVYGGLCLAEKVFPNTRLSRARESLEACQPRRLERRAARLRAEHLLSPSNGAVFGSPFSRLAWVESPADGFSLARDILRPRHGRGATAYLARASQLIRNHVVAPLRAPTHSPAALLPSPTKASLHEVRHV